MIYKSMKECVDDLEKNNHLIRIKDLVDPDLEMAEIHRRVFDAKGPAILFENIKNTSFPAVSNLFGTLKRSRFIFRSTLKRVANLIALKADPLKILTNPSKLLYSFMALSTSLPKKITTGPVLFNKTTIDKLPMIKCWPDDGGAFILLPQVYSEDPVDKKIFGSNLGMYRIQISGNQYKTNQEIGLHYQIKRDIAYHHAKAIKNNIPLKVSIFAGGPPAHTFAAVMPLPEELPEIAFAGAFSGKRFRYIKKKGFTISADADFCITGTVALNKTMPEGPFGDHLGYYSLKHEFPYINVDSVYHKKDAIWPFTVVGQPPQEDTSFGSLIHEIIKPVVPVELPGLDSMHAVDAAGVHPLLLAIGRESYVPFGVRKPKELLQIANSILGFGQCSLAKYLFIVAKEDNPDLDITNVEDFFIHLFERINFERDLHFQTKTTIDTLDYSGENLNEGSKLFITVCGEKRRTLANKLPPDLTLPTGFINPGITIPGVMTVTGPKFTYPIQKSSEIPEDIITFLNHFNKNNNLNNIALIVIVDDSRFVQRNLNSFLWVTFTRSNPSHDIYGINSFIKFKHFGCKGPFIIDARLKPHHAPPLLKDPKTTKKVDALGKKGGSLYKII